MTPAKAKKIVIVELTVSCAQANERKKSKYEKLIQECRQAAWNYPVEVGCRISCPIVGKMFQDIGIVGKTTRNLAIKKAAQIAERCSSWLWLSLCDKAAMRRHKAVETDGCYWRLIFPGPCLSMIVSSDKLKVSSN